MAPLRQGLPPFYYPRSLLVGLDPPKNDRTPPVDTSQSMVYQRLRRQTPTLIESAGNHIYSLPHLEFVWKESNLLNLLEMAIVAGVGGLVGLLWVVRIITEFRQVAIRAPILIPIPSWHYLNYGVIFRR